MKTKCALAILLALALSFAFSAPASADNHHRRHRNRYERGYGGGYYIGVPQVYVDLGRRDYDSRYDRYEQYERPSGRDVRDRRAYVPQIDPIVLPSPEAPPVRTPTAQAHNTTPTYRIPSAAKPEFYRNGDVLCNTSNYKFEVYVNGRISAKIKPHSNVSVSDLPFWTPGASLSYKKVETS